MKVRILTKIVVHAVVPLPLFRGVTENASLQFLTTTTIILYGRAKTCNIILHMHVATKNTSNTHPFASQILT